MEQDFVAQTALDQMVGSDGTQLLKAAVPYLPQKGQQIVSLYAKLAELFSTISLFSGKPSDKVVAAASIPSQDPLEILGDIRRFCYGNSRRQLDQLVNAFAMVQMFSIMNSQKDTGEEAFQKEKSEPEKEAAL